MEYLNEISEVNANNLKMKFNYVFDAFDELIERYSDINEYEEDQETVETDMTANIHPKIVSHFISSIHEVRKNFEKYLCQLPVVGFNSGKYDINLIKREIVLFISENYNDNEIFTIKKNNSYISISTPHLKFLDISNFLAAGCSYSQFLKLMVLNLIKVYSHTNGLILLKNYHFLHFPNPKIFFQKF